MTTSRYSRRTALYLSAMGSLGVSAGAHGASQEPFTFVQLCDPQLGMGEYERDKENFRKAVAKINALQPDFVAICGDLVHDANDQSFADFKQIHNQLTVPSYLVSGNHDVGRHPSPTSLQRYRDLFGKDYFTFEHKGFLFVVVNTQLWKSPVAGETEKQDLWLAKTLAAAKSEDKPVFILGHYPYFLVAPDEPDEYMNLPLETRTRLLRLFKEQGVVAVLGGHAHCFIQNEFEGIQLVNGESTCKNFDMRPFGFRVWHVEGTRPYRHVFKSI